MIDTALVRSLAEGALTSEKQFVVDVKVSASNEITVTIDSDDEVNIDDLIGINRAIEAGLDRDAEDFELNVTSAGIGQPLVMLRQYRKLIDKDVEMVLRDGSKLIAVLKAADEGSVTVAYSEKVAVEGRKRKVLQEVVRVIPMEEVKITREHLNFK